jgi:hypothetical protein
MPSHQNAKTGFWEQDFGNRILEIGFSVIFGDFW